MPNRPSSIASSEGSLSNMIRNIGQKTSPTIQINVNGSDESWVKTYSTLDRIEGTVTVTYPVNTVVEDIQISFVGLSKTFVDRLTSSTAVSGRTEAYHQFLKLTQPIPERTLPDGMLFEAGKAYTFNFLFVVPEQLLPRVCRHTVDSHTVHLEHIHVPPSMGDSSITGRGRTLLDDYAPDMARIRYAVSASVQEASLGGSAAKPVVQTKKIRIMPAIDEKPPVSIDGPDNDYTMRSERDVRKGIFKGKTGRIVVEAAQPKAIHVPSIDSEDQTPESTVATVSLRFDPADDKAQPPKLGNLATKFKIATFFSSSARSRLPSKKHIQSDLNQGMHAESINLASRCVSAAEWQYHPAGSSLDRRSSTLSTSSGAIASLPEPSTKYTGGGFYTAQVLVPVSLPANKVWIPTFHSCLVSRVYSLGVKLSVSGSGLPSTGVELKLPVQITTTGNPSAQGRPDRSEMSAEETAVEAVEADEFFAPMTVRARAQSQQSMDGAIRRNMRDGWGQVQDLPPDYADSFPAQGNRVPVLA